MSFYHWNSCLSVDNLQFSPFLCLIFFRCEMKLSELEKSNSIIDVFKKKRPRLSPLFGAILQIRWLIVPCSHIIRVVRDLLYTTWSMLNEKLALAKLKNKKLIYSYLPCHAFCLFICCISHGSRDVHLLFILNSSVYVFARKFLLWTINFLKKLLLQNRGLYRFDDLLNNFVFPISVHFHIMSVYTQSNLTDNILLTLSNQS